MSILGYWLRTEAEKLTAEKINKFEGQPFAYDGSSKIYGHIFEVNSYKFLKIKIIAPIRIETFDGCKVTFNGGSELFSVESDSTEINTDFSFSLHTGITEFDIDIEEKLINMILEEKLHSISIDFGKVNVTCPIKDISQLKSLFKHE